MNKFLNNFKKMASATIAATIVTTSIGMAPVALAETAAPSPAPAILETSAPATPALTSTDTDLALVAADKEALNDESIKGMNIDLSHVTTSLINPLPSKGANGSTITWTSSDYTVVSNDGQTVVRPNHLAGDATVPLFATIKKGTITETKVFTLKVLQLASNVATISPFGTYGVGANGKSEETIARVPAGTTKAIFLSSLAKDEPNQTWDATAIQDPVVTGDKLIVTAEDGTTKITYTVKTLEAPKPVPVVTKSVKPTKRLPKKIVPPFKDTESHWSEGYVEELRLKGILIGLKDGTFGPDTRIRRGELVKVVVEAYRIPLPKKVTKKPFSDVEITDWDAPYITAAKNAHLISGYSDGKFKPSFFISRGDALKLLLRAAKIRITPKAVATFKDTNDESWYSKYLNYAQDKGVVIGYQDGNFRPFRKTSRSEFSKMIVEISKLKKLQQK